MLGSLEAWLRAPRWFARLAIVVAMATIAPAMVSRADERPGMTYVALWFDTEDYLLPASDDAALRLADWLTERHIRATFKVVGEKARVLESRSRSDVIAALSAMRSGTTRTGIACRRLRRNIVRHSVGTRGLSSSIAANGRASTM